MADTTIKAGTYCPVCRGTPLTDCVHSAEEFRGRALSRTPPAPDEDVRLVERLRLVDQYIRKLNPNATIGLHCLEAAARIEQIPLAVEAARREAIEEVVRWLREQATEKRAWKSNTTPEDARSLEYEARQCDRAADAIEARNLNRKDQCDG